jgi:hypothetical protein
MSTLTMFSFNLRQIEGADVRSAFIQGVKFACEKAKVTLVLHRSDGLSLDPVDEQLFDRVYCGHDRKVIVDRTGKAQQPVATPNPPRRRRPPSAD